MKTFFQKFLTFIFILILFLSSCAQLLLYPIRNAVKTDTIKAIINDINLEKMSENDENFKQAMDETLEPVYKQAKEYGIDEKTILKIIDSKEVKDFIGDISGNLIHYVFTGENQKAISVEGIKELVSDAIDRVSKETNIKISEANKQDILDIVEENQDIYMEYIPETKDLENIVIPDQYKPWLDFFQFLTGKTLQLYLLLAAGISALLIALLNWKNQRWIKKLAVTIMSACITTLVVFGVIWFGLFVIIKVDEPYIFMLLEKLLFRSLILTGSILIGTIIVIILYSIITKKKKKEITTKEEKNKDSSITEEQEEEKEKETSDDNKEEKNT